MKHWWLGLIFIGLFQGCKEEKKAAPEVVIVQKQDTLWASPQTGKRITKYFKNLPAGFSGSIGYLSGDSILVGTNGYADFRKKQKITGNTLFQLASVSKPLTAYAIMRMAESGAIKLTDSVEQYFPDFPYRGITIELLLSHRSGLSNYMYITDSAWQIKEIPMCNDDALQCFFDLKPAPYSRPDRSFNYNNTNYFLLAAIIEKVSKLPYEAYMQQNVFKPLGMNSTFVGSSMESVENQNIALGHDNRLRPESEYYLNGVTGDKGIYSSAFDMLKFAKHLLDSSNAALYNIMSESHSKFDRAGRSYGLGFRLKKTDQYPEEIVYHTGWWRGFRTYFVLNKADRKAIVVLSNTTVGPFIPVADLYGLLK